MTDDPNSAQLKQTLRPRRRQSAQVPQGIGVRPPLTAKASGKRLATAAGTHVDDLCGGDFGIRTDLDANAALLSCRIADRPSHHHRSQSTIDLVLDTIGGETQEASWHVMAPGGLLVSIASDPAAGAARWPQLRGAFLFIQPNAPVLERLAALVDAGKLQPIVCAEFALENIRQAHALSETGRATGKIALHVGLP